MEAPKSVELFSLPEDETLTARQWAPLLAIGDTVVPSLGEFERFKANPKLQEEIEKRLQKAATKGAPDDIGAKVFEEKATSHPRYKELVERQLAFYTCSKERKQLAIVLSLLTTTAGSVILTGKLTPFHLQPLETRQEILFAWRSSCIPALRVLYAKMIVLSLKSWLVTSETFPKLIGFPTYPQSTTRNPSYNFEFIDISSIKPEATIETEVLIVGSGCGGGVCAKNLAEAGHKVLVVEKSHHYSTEHFPMQAVDGSYTIFENGGAIIGDDASILTIAGSTWGGGGLVNWSASIHTQDYVRKEWAEEGLTFFQEEKFARCLDKVADRMGVSTKYIKHNFANEKLLEAGKKLGLKVVEIPQNTGNQEHDCGYCSLGCSSATKQGPAVSFLPDAARAGARFIEGFTVDTITFDEKSPSSAKKATGVTGTWRTRDRKHSQPLRIHAKTVIISAGTMSSPLILTRSGLKNPNIGRNLHLHPVAFSRARYEQEIKPWEGAIMTGLVDLETCKIEIPTMLPLTCALMTPWKGGLDTKLQVSQFHHWTSTIALTRDRDSGRVYPDPQDGSCHMDYRISAHDAQSMLDGIIASSKIHYLNGAIEIASPNPFIENWIRNDTEEAQLHSSSSESEPTFPASLTTFLTSLQSHASPLRGPGVTLVSAHQMGTCRMSTSPKTGVTDGKGKVWGTEGLYVADASLFPNASGANPMLTTLGIAEWVSEGIVEEKRREKEE